VAPQQLVWCWVDLDPCHCEGLKKWYCLITAPWLSLNLYFYLRQHSSLLGVFYMYSVLRMFAKITIQLIALLSFCSNVGPDQVRPTLGPIGPGPACGQCSCKSVGLLAHNLSSASMLLGSLNMTASLSGSWHIGLRWLKLCL